MSSREDGLLRALLAEACRRAGVQHGQLLLIAAQGTVGCSHATRQLSPSGLPPFVVRDDAGLLTALAADVIHHVAEPDHLFGRTTRTGAVELVAVRLDAADGTLVGAILLEADARHAGELVQDNDLRDFARLAGLAAGEHCERRDASERLRELTQRHASLQTVGKVERRFGRLLAGPGGAAAMVELCAQLTGKAAVLYAEDHHVIAGAGIPRGKVALPQLKVLLDAAWSDDLGDVPELAEVEPRAMDGLPWRHLLAKVATDDQHFGWLVLLENPSRLRPYDSMVLRCAKHFLARELDVQRRVASVAWNARSSLTRQLVRGTNDLDDLRTSGEYLGVKTEARRVLVYVTHPCSLADDVQRLSELMQRRLGLEVLATRGSEGIMLLVEAPPSTQPGEFVGRVKAELRAMAAAPFGPKLTAGVSSVCDPPGLARAYREAREVAHCIERFAPSASARVLAVDDLGPARLFIANSGVAAVRNYVDDVLGQLLTGKPGVAGLVATLDTYFACGRSVRAAAVDLGIHENTVRLRLARVHTVTGLDVLSDANDQLSAQTALLVLRLQGHPALPAFDEGADVPDVRTA